MRRLKVVWGEYRGYSYLYGSFFILVFITTYCAWHANFYISGNSDDIVYPYLFSHFKLHDLILPSQHSNVLKFPLYLVQSLLPYNFTTFSIVNLGLELITTISWAIILAWTFSKRYVPVICAVLCCFLLGSRLLSIDLVGTTFRNIEYPIAFGFVILVGTLLESSALKRSQIVWGVVLGLLYSLTVAGDSFFLYTVSSSTAIVLFYNYLAKRGKNLSGLRNAVSYLLLVNFLALLFREAVKHSGISRFFTDPMYLPHVLPLNHLAPSLTTAFEQLISLTGANIFGQSIRPSNAIFFINFGLLAVGLWGMSLVVRDNVIGRFKPSKAGRRSLFARNFFLQVCSIAFLIVFIVYVVSDLVVTLAADGSITSSGQERYITLLPFLLVVGVVYAVKRYSISLRLSTALALWFLLLVGISASSPSIERVHANDSSMRLGPMALASVARQNKVQLVVTGYWYGASTRFWSNDSIDFAPVAFCNSPAPPINNRISWYKPSLSVHVSGVLVARQGMDAIYSTCADKMLLSIYGQPKKVVDIPSPDKPKLWIYSYDVRARFVSVKPTLETQ